MGKIKQYREIEKPDCIIKIEVSQSAGINDT